MHTHKHTHLISPTNFKNQGKEKKRNNTHTFTSFREGRKRTTNHATWQRPEDWQKKTRNKRENTYYYYQETRKRKKKKDGRLVVRNTISNSAKKTHIQNCSTNTDAMKTHICTRLLHERTFHTQSHAHGHAPLTLQRCELMLYLITCPSRTVSVDWPWPTDTGIALRKLLSTFPITLHSSSPLPLRLPWRFPPLS